MGNLFGGFRRTTEAAPPPPSTTTTTTTPLTSSNNANVSSSSPASTTTAPPTNRAVSSTSTSTTSLSSDSINNRDEVAVVATVRGRSRMRKRPREDEPPPPPRRRVRTRGSEAALQTLASLIADGNNKNVVFITGAGLSIASGIRPFRSNPLPADGYDSSTSSSPVRRRKSNKRTTTRNNNKKKKKHKHVLQAGLWNDVIWSTATRTSFHKDPLKWYNEFWLPHFCGQGGGSNSADNNTNKYRPNPGHHVLDALLQRYRNVKQITQNIDGLQSAEYNDNDDEDDEEHEIKQLIEVHGRASLFKCCGGGDDDNGSLSDNSSNDDDDDDYKNNYSIDSDSDDNGERTVHLGHRRQSRLMRQRSLTLHSNNNKKKKKQCCPYQYLKSLTADQLIPYRGDDDAPSTPTALLSESNTSGNSNSLGQQQQQPRQINILSATSITKDAIPACPACHSLAIPQALLFDEGYHSHSFYQFEKAEDWLHTADALVFVGTSFAVRLTKVALQHARDHQLPVFNFNLSHDILKSTATLNASNIVGPATETLPKLWEACCRLQEENNNNNNNENADD